MQPWAFYSCLHYSGLFDSMAPLCPVATELCTKLLLRVHSEQSMPTAQYPVSCICRQDQLSPNVMARLGGRVLTRLGGPFPGHPSIEPILASMHRPGVANLQSIAAQRTTST